MDSRGMNPRGRPSGALVSTLFTIALLAAGRSPAGASAPPPGLQEKPALARQGSEVVAVWSDLRDGGGGRVYWTRFAGAIPDSSGVALAGGCGSETSPALAAGDTWSLAVWECWTDTGTGVRGAELPAVTGLPGTVREVEAPTLSTRRPAAAVQGDSALVAWEGADGLRVALWERGGGPVVPGGTPLLPDGIPRHHPRVAPLPGGWFLLFTEDLPGEPSRVRGIRLEDGGAPVGAAVALSAPGVEAWASDLVAGGNGLTAVWTRREGTLLSTVLRALDATGTPLGPPVVHAPSPGRVRFSPRLARLGDVATLAWIEQSSTGRGIRRGTVDSLLALAPPQGVEVVGEESQASDLALTAGPGGMLAAWRLPLPGDDDDLHGVVFAPGDSLPASSSSPLIVTAEGALSVPEPSPAIPLLTASPNPFSGRLVVRRRAPALGGSRIAVFDLTGARVGEIPLDASGAGTWTGRGPRGERLPGGIYFLRDEGGGPALRVVRLR